MVIECSEERGVKAPLSFYIHLPFCKSQCPYCHFFVVKDNHTKQALYMKALHEEFSLYKDFLTRPITSLYLGGGTPSRFLHLEQLLSFFPVSQISEITIEINPEDLTWEKARWIRSLGITRASIGVQSFSPRLLKKLGRQHDGEKAKEAVYMLSQAGIRNISIDLMFEIPEQTLNDWEDSIKQATTLPITHLSLYNLTFEEGTSFYKRKSLLKQQIVSEEIGAVMIERAEELLQSCGIHRYEISAFAKEGMESIHNTGYWKGREFIGLGASAYSYLNGSRFQNIADFDAYIFQAATGKAPIHFSETLSTEASLRERVAIELRMFEGIRIDTMEKYPKALVADLNRLVEEGLLEYSKTHIRLSKRGKQLYDLVGVALV